MDGVLTCCFSLGEPVWFRLLVSARIWHRLLMQSSLRWCVFFFLLDLRDRGGGEKPNESKIALTKRWRFHMPSIMHLVLMIKATGSYQKSIKAFRRGGEPTVNLYAIKKTLIRYDPLCVLKDASPYWNFQLESSSVFLVGNLGISNQEMQTPLNK